MGHPIAMLTHVFPVSRCFGEMFRRPTQQSRQAGNPCHRRHRLLADRGLKDSGHRGCRSSFLGEVTGGVLDDASRAITHPCGERGSEDRYVAMGGIDCRSAGLARQSQPRRRHHLVTVADRGTPARRHSVHTSSVDA
jgi:hypothetical protein